MPEKMFDTGLGYKVTDEETGTSLLEFFPINGVPGVGETTLSDAAPKGARCVDYSTGLWYWKHTAGAGAANWELSVTQGDLASAGGGDSWREPVIVRDNTAYANLAAAETAMNGGTVDGVAVVDTDRILYPNITGENKNVFIVTGTPGAAATLVEDTNAPTANDALYVTSGTDAGTQWNYSTTASNWVLSNQSDLDELGFLRVFVGKSAAGSETPTYTSTNYVANADSLEVAIGKLDAQVALNDTAIGNNATSISNLQTEVDNIETAMGTAINADGTFNATALDGGNYMDTSADVTAALLDLDTQIKVNADAIAGISNDDANQNSFMGKTGLGAETPTYSSVNNITQNGDLVAAIGELDAALSTAYVGVVSGSITAATVVDSVLVDDVKMVRWMVHVQTGANVRTYEIDATHDGTAGADATTPDHTKYAKLAIGGTIAGLSLTITLTGVTTAQAMNLVAASTGGVIVSVTRTMVL